MADRTVDGDFCLETTTVEGTGNVTTLGAISGFRALSAAMTVNGDTATVVIAAGSQREAVLVTRVSATEYSRAATPIRSTNGGSAVSFTAGTKEIWIDFPGSRIMMGGKGADIAAATTLDLDDATAGQIDITGNTQIDAVTLSEGRTVWGRFTGTPQLTNGASLVVKGGTRTMVAGDEVRFMGYAAGVVRATVFPAAGLVAASTTVAGIVELATDAEAQAIADTARAITPANLAAMVATQANQETGTALDRFVVSGRQHSHPSAIKAWAKLTGTGTIALNASFNVSTPTDNGTGDYTFPFSVAMSTANYAYSYGSSQVLTILSAAVAASIRVVTRSDLSTNADASSVSIMAAGDQ